MYLNYIFQIFYYGIVVLYNVVLYRNLNVALFYCLSKRWSAMIYHFQLLELFEFHFECKI